MDDAIICNDCGRKYLQTVKDKCPHCYGTFMPGGWNGKDLVSWWEAKLIDAGYDDFNSVIRFFPYLIIDQ